MEESNRRTPPFVTTESDDDDGDNGGSLDKRVVAYYPGWAGSEYPPEEVPYDRLSHLAYAFLEPQSDGTVVLGDSSEDDLLTNLGRYNDGNTALLFSISAGWYSGDFSDAASTSDNRRRFAATAVDHVVDYGFEGLDLDWEFPDGSIRENDPDNLVKLLEQCRRELDDRVGTGAPLTIAVSADETVASDAYEDAIFDSVDYVSVMAYDFHDDWSDVTSFNAPLASSSAVPDGQQGGNVGDSMTYWAERSPSKAMLNMGIPFYGRSFTGVVGTNDGLFEAFSDRSAETFSSIKDTYESDPSYEYHWHHEAEEAWLYSGADEQFIAYDDEAAVSNKLRFLKDRGYGGAMCWALSQDDDDDTLISAVDREMKTSEPAPSKPGMNRAAADSSNYTDVSRTAEDIDWYVVHVAEGSYEDTIGWFQIPDADASIHYVIENDDPASVTRMVDEEASCWHTGHGGYDDRSLGVEHEGYTDETDFDDGLVETSAAVAQWACLTYDIPLAVRRFDRAPRDPSDGDGGVIGHAQVPALNGDSANGHSDPGSTWNWGRFEGYLRRNRLAHREHLVTNVDVAVRDGPDGSQHDTAPSGTTGTVVDGPVDRDGVRWYDVVYDGGVSNGWSAGDDLLYSRFNVGHVAVAVADGVNVRYGPGTSYDAPDSATGGTRGTVVGGPVDDEGWRWFEIDWDDGTSTGWSADCYLDQGY